jgi:single-strand DNA-binding protein
MANLNRVLLIGRLTKDPELRFTPQGTPVCDLNLATNRVIKSADGNSREETCFVEITVWGRQAETSAEYLKKGREVFVEGRLTLDRWETPEGQKRSRLRVTAERVQFLGGPRSAPPAAREVAPEPEAEPEPTEEAPPGDVPF